MSGSRGSLDNSDRDRVREASDIAQVIGEHLTLHAKGREYIGLCPFHDDHKPSMYVVPSKQIFHCFSCGAGGDVFTFVQKYHGMEFPEALKLLADRAGIELTRRAPRQDQQHEGGPGREALLDATSFANAFFQKILRHEQHGADARTLIERRGISDEMIEAFELGASADRWDGLIQTARAQRGPDEASMLGAGLIKSRDKSDGCYDAFRNRLIFPIHDRFGRVIAFGGRRIEDTEEAGPKYLNSPETRLFNKSKTLFGLFRANRAIQRERTAVVVEGYVDVIACHQAGFEHVVGTLGTALTQQHAAELRGLCDEVVLLFDGDEAGLRAADRAFDVLLAERLDIRMVTLAGEDGVKDPDDLLKLPDGKQRFQALLDNAQDLLSFWLDRMGGELRDAGPAARQRIAEEACRRLAGARIDRADPVRKGLLLQRLSDLTGVQERQLRAMIGSSTGGGRPVPAAEEQQEQHVGGDALRILGGRPLSAAELALGCLLAEPKLWTAITAEGQQALRAAAYGSEVSKAVGHAAIDMAQDGRHPTLAEVMSSVMADGQATAVALEERVAHQVAEDARAAFVRGCVDRLLADARAEQAAGDARGVAAALARRNAGAGGARFPGRTRRGSEPRPDGG
ncbi:MAG: DNA primase [Planctomycetota bacterium]